MTDSIAYLEFLYLLVLTNIIGCSRFFSINVILFSDGVDPLMNSIIFPKSDTVTSTPEGLV